MTIRSLIVLAALTPIAVVADQNETDIAAIAAVIDDFHDAAADGDKERYLGHLTERAVFMGTDEWERWPKQPEMRDYVSGRFKDGQGWNYRSVERNVRLADAADVAWFDEVVFSEQNGRFRGTGVLSKRGGEWKIEHHAMSFLVFNEDWPTVIELSRETARKKAAQTGEQ